jgi:molybdopterin/thiamine biosynthesis adenylyltransferase
MKYDNNHRYNRNIGVWTEDFQEKLKNVTVGVAGLGGAGGVLTSILARNGFGRVKIADPAMFATPDFQRQFYAKESTLGLNKTDAAKRELLDINSEIKIIAYRNGLSKENLDDFLDGCDFVHEVIDYSLPELKTLIHRKARKKGIIVTTSAIVGCGCSTFVFHPDGMSFEQYFEQNKNSENKKQSPEKIMRIDPDYLSKEFFLERVKQGTIPTSCDGGYLTGITTAAVYKRILMGKEVAYVPKVMRVDFLDDLMYNKTIYE